jgi:hypothetical protein
MVTSKQKLSVLGLLLDSEDAENIIMYICDYKQDFGLDIGYIHGIIHC